MTPHVPLESCPADAVAVLERRRDRLRAAPATQGDETVLWTAEFPLGDLRLALPLAALRAAVPLRAVTPVPLSPPHVVGILRFQGQIISALSLAAMIKARGWHVDPTVLLVVDPGWGVLTGLDCEQIPRPLALPHARVEEAQAQHDGPLVPVTTRDLAQVHLIDLTRLLDRRRSASSVARLAPTHGDAATQGAGDDGP